MRKFIKLILLYLSVASFWACLQKDALVKQNIALTGFQSYWFEDENTLFIFYSIRNEHGFSPDAEMQVQYDDVNWINVEAVSNVHVHKEAICGDDFWCKSLSVRLDRKPDILQLRYLYHRQGELSEVYTEDPLDMNAFAPESRDSFQVYGIFSEDNRFVQWRGYHNFPGLTQSQVNAYGLVRGYSVDRAYVGSSSLDVNLNNLTLYGQLSDCDSQTEYSQETLSSEQGNPSWLTTILPEANDSDPWVCTLSTIATGNGDVTKAAVARKNPEFTALPQSLGLSFQETKIIQILYATCDQDRDQDYLDFQAERMLFESSEVDACIDGDSFNRLSLAQDIEAKILAQRSSSDQEVSLNVILHYTNSDVGFTAQAEVENALTTVVGNSALNLNAVFVYDSFEKASLNTTLQERGAWCPTIITAQSAFGSCYLVANQFSFGPLEIRSSPVFPSYTQYQELDETDLNDIQINSIKLYAPTSELDNLRIRYFEDLGLYYLFDGGDSVSAETTHAFSYCSTKDESQALAAADISLIDDTDGEGFSTMESFPDYHLLQEEDKSYLIGVQLFFPYLMEIDYRRTLRIGPRSLVGYVAIRRSQSAAESLGDPRFLLGQIALEGPLKQCISYCNHPSFNDQSEYSLSESWEQKYRNGCYEPSYPVVGGG